MGFVPMRGEGGGVGGVMAIRPHSVHLGHTSNRVNAAVHMKTGKNEVVNFDVVKKLEEHCVKAAPLLREGEGVTAAMADKLEVDSLALTEAVQKSLMERTMLVAFDAYVKSQTDDTYAALKDKQSENMGVLFQEKGHVERVRAAIQTLLVRYVKQTVDIKHLDEPTALQQWADDLFDAVNLIKLLGYMIIQESRTPVDRVAAEIVEYVASLCMLCSNLAELLSYGHPNDQAIASKETWDIYLRLKGARDTLPAFAENDDLEDETVKAFLKDNEVAKANIDMYWGEVKNACEICIPAYGEAILALHAQTTQGLVDQIDAIAGGGKKSYTLWYSNLDASASFDATYKQAQSTLFSNKGLATKITNLKKKLKDSLKEFTTTASEVEMSDAKEVTEMREQADKTMKLANTTITEASILQVLKPHQAKLNKEELIGALEAELLKAVDRKISVDDLFEPIQRKITEVNGT